MYQKYIYVFNNDNLRRRSPGAGGLWLNHIPYSNGQRG